MIILFLKRLWFRIKLIGKLLLILMSLLLPPLILFGCFFLKIINIVALFTLLIGYIIFLMLNVFFRVIPFTIFSAHGPYTFYNPIDKKLTRSIKKIFKRKYFNGSFKKINTLNWIRFNNIRVSFWSNAGAIFALGIAFGSIIFTILYGVLEGSMNEPQKLLHNNDDIYVTIYSRNNFKNTDSLFVMSSSVIDSLAAKTHLQLDENLNEKNPTQYYYNQINDSYKTFIKLLVSILMTIVLLITLFPLFLRQIIYKLPSDQYATISLSNLNRSEMLTFVSLRYWELCDDFITTVVKCDNKKNIDETLYMLKSISDSPFNFYRKEIKKQDEILEMRDGIIDKFSKSLQNYINKNKIGLNDLDDFFKRDDKKSLLEIFKKDEITKIPNIELEKVKKLNTKSIEILLEIISDKETRNKFYENIQEVEIKLQLKLKEFIKDFFSELYKDINEFRKNKTKINSNAKSLKLEVTRLLGILPIEFSHHITKFSPHIFEQRVYTLIHSVSTVQYIIENIENQEKDGTREKKSYCKELIKAIDEVYSIIYDIEYKRKKYLAQLIIFDEIHDDIIDMASVTSTSKSLRIFTRGLSQLINKVDDTLKSNTNYEKYKSLRYIRETNQYDPFIALLHRSKAHYGFDLLITLENYYNKNLYKINVPKHLEKIKNWKNKNNKTELNLEIKKHTKLFSNIREDVASKHNKAMKTISESFKIKFTELIGKQEFDNIYILVFGYSSIVKRTLQNNKDLLNKNDVKIIVMKEDSDEMLDTRILRFELDSKQVRNTFTGSDELIKRLLGKNDLLVMTAGAEAYDVSNQRLFHTNNYQKRVEHLISYFGESVLKPNPYVYIIAGNYKIYNKFPDPNNKKFSNEFFVDHYDKVDVYNFKDLMQKVTLITDDEEAFRKNEINNRFIKINNY